MIRLLTILLFIFIGFISKAQFPYTQTIGNKTTLVKAPGGIGADSTIVFIAAYADTATANLGFIDAIAGSVIRTTDNNLWLRNNAASAWVKVILTGAGAGTVTSVSFTGGLISVANPTSTPAFTVAGTSGGIPYFSSSSTWASSSALTANALMIGGGAGAAPSTTTTGTGVLTALGINVGSTGAFLTKGNAVYTVAASNSPAVLKARADYICDGTADENEINTALALGNVTLAEGTYNIAATIAVPDNTWLKGSGDGTILAVTTGISVITDNGTTGIYISDLKITGNGTASQRGIYMTSVGSGTGTTAVTGCVIENVYITGTDLAGIELEQCANSIINNIRTSDIDFDGIVIDRGARTTVSNTVHNGNFAGIFVTGATSTHVTIINNIIEGSLDIGIQIENATDCVISDNIVRSSESFCLDIQNCERMLVNGNTLDGSVSQVVFNTSSVPNSIFTNNLIINGQLEGFIISSCENSTVTGNTIYNNSLLTNNTYDAVSIFSDDVTFVGNTVKRGTGNQHRYGLRITLGSDRNLIADNKFYQSGATGDINDNSTLTRKRNNQANDGTWLDLLYTNFQLEMNTSKLLGRSTASQGKAEEITVGTGVFTALGVNTGSAGAFVVNGGALGTPSSGTLTNATGLPEAGLTLADNTTNNTSTSAHGFFPKLTSNTVYYVNNSGALTALALGASGTVLTSNGATSAPTWETGGGGSSTWNGITNPTGDQALTFDAGESSTWTDANTTEDLFTVNSSTGTTNSMFSLNRTGTALAAGNNIMELVSSGANGTNGITATGLSISVTNTNGTSGTNIGASFTASGATTANYSAQFTGAIVPGTSDGSAIGTTTLQWSDLFLAEGGVINWDNGDMTLTQTNNSLAVAGGDFRVAEQIYTTGSSAGVSFDDRTAASDYSIFVSAGLFNIHDAANGFSPIVALRNQSTGLSTAGTNTTPTSFWHLKAGTATATQAPLKFTAGTNLTAPEAGAVEFDGTNYFVTASTTRYTVAKTLTATATLNFGSTAAGAASDLTITVTGAAVGDAVYIGVDNASVTADNIGYWGWVSSSNTVTIRFNNNNLTGSVDPASGTFRAVVTKY